MASYKITMVAINSAIKAAGNRGDNVKRILYQDIGLTPESANVAGGPGPHSSYHKQTRAQAKSAAVEGADAPATKPDTEAAPDAELQ